MSTQTTPKKVLTFRPSHEVRERLENLAHQTNRPVSFYLNSILEEHLSEIEHAYLLKQEAEDIRSGRAPSYTLEEVSEELGL